MTGPDDVTAPQERVSEEAPVRLFEPDELNQVIRKWRDIQADFVDQPKRAMQEADELVSELIDRLTRTFADQREQLEARWGNSESVSTEDLRMELQRYRSFFERLIAA